MLITALSIAEGAGHNGANVVARITHTDLDTATADTAQVKTLLQSIGDGTAYNGGVNVNAWLKDVKLVQPFENSADSAFNDLQVKVGDSADDDQFLVATQINRNGTEATAPSPIMDPITAAATSITATFTPAGGKNVAALDKGIIDLYFFIQDGRQ